MREIAQNPGVGARMGHRVTIKPLHGHPLYRWRATYIEGGRRRQKGFKTKTAAERWAEERECEAKEHGTKSTLSASERSAIADNRAKLLSIGVDLRGAIELAIYGTEKLGALGVDLKSAIDFAANYYERTKKSCLVHEMVAKVIEAREKAGLSERYLIDLKSRLGRFEKDFGDRAVAVITRDEIANWLDGLNLSLVSRNNYRRVLVVMFSEAISDGYLEDGKNPAQKVKVAKVIETEVGILTPAQTADLLAAADDRIMPAIAIGAFAGLRDSEIHALDWAEVDLIGGHIRVRAKNSKSSRNRLVAISENLRAWLKPFANESGPIWPRNGRKLMEAARSAAGISNWPSNALRHSFGSYALAFRRDAAAVALEMGHESTRIIFRHYRELVSPEIAAKYWEIRPSK